MIGHEIRDASQELISSLEEGRLHRVLGFPGLLTKLRIVPTLLKTKT